MANMNKTFFELTLEECYELFETKHWVFIYCDGKFGGMRIERPAATGQF